MTKPADDVERAGRDSELTRGPVGPTLRGMAIPMCFGFVAIVVFNLTDTWFASRLGTDELAAMSFTFPVVALISSLSAGLGVGATAVLSAAIGADRTTEVRQMARNGLFLAVAVVALFATLGLFTMDPMFRALGADDSTLPLVREYMTIWYLGMVFLVVPMVGNAMIRATGDTRTPAILMILAAIINIALDPVFMFGFAFVPAMGLQGAAVASVISRALALALALMILIGNKRMVEVALPRLPAMLRHWKSFLAIGAPAAASNSLIPMSAMLVTALIASYGPAAVAGYGAGTRVQMMAFVVPMSLAASLIPFVGQNWGAGNHDRVRKALDVSQRFILVYGLLAWAIIALLADPIAGLFSDEAAVVEAMKTFLRIALLGLAPVGTIVLATWSLNGMHRPLLATALTAIHMFGAFVPLAYAGAALWGLEGAFLGMVLANGIGSVLGYLLPRSTVRGHALRGSKDQAAA